MIMLRRCIREPGACSEHSMSKNVRVDVVDQPGDPLHGERQVVCSEAIQQGDVAPYNGMVVHDEEIAETMSSPKQLLAHLHFRYGRSAFPSAFYG